MDDLDELERRARLWITEPMRKYADDDRGQRFEGDVLKLISEVRRLRQVEREPLTFVLSPIGVTVRLTEDEHQLVMMALSNLLARILEHRKADPMRGRRSWHGAASEAEAVENLRRRLHDLRWPLIEARRVQLQEAADALEAAQGGPPAHPDLQPAPADPMRAPGGPGPLGSAQGDLPGVLDPEAP